MVESLFLRESRRYLLAEPARAIGSVATGVPYSEIWVDFLEISSLETPNLLAKEELGIAIPITSSSTTVFGFLRVDP